MELNQVGAIFKSRNLVRAQKVETNQVHFKSSEQFVALFCKLEIDCECIPDMVSSRAIFCLIFIKCLRFVI